MLPNPRIVLMTLAAVLAGASIGLGLMTSTRNASVFAIGLRSAQGSPVSRTLPEPPDWKQSVARAAERRAHELERLLELEAFVPRQQPMEPPPTGSLPDAAPEPAAPAPPAEPLHPQ
jgi:hypothetical protein